MSISINVRELLANVSGEGKKSSEHEHIKSKRSDLQRRKRWWRTQPGQRIELGGRTS